ncbi:hypothetical protein PV08_07424 [Exophiala spinifera]|uniref:Uncharacterized protein n=1 Tax=Exophiala spinifera TaxID=91928 RepID=A0A0D2B7I3_9EURO|nr:uncharacterized protein PV08_07424 [Exophiala spinifera]KIW14640.1 hypothetical protein PV08_07424 [Exophiala spinifera]
MPQKAAADLETGSPALKPKDFDYLFSRDDRHELFLEMVKVEVSNILSDYNLPSDGNANSTNPSSSCSGGNNNNNNNRTIFTTSDGQLLRRIAETQMKKALEDRIKEKQDVDKGIYTLLGRESIEAVRAINQAVVTIAALGAGFTFTVIFSGLAPPNKGSTEARVRLSVAVAWLLFVLAMSLASYATVLQAMREQMVTVTYRWRVAQGLILAGALCASAEAVRAYEAAVGVTAFVLIPTVTIGWMAWTNRFRVWKLIKK